MLIFQKNRSACRTVLHAEPFCVQNRSACGTLLRAEPFCVRNYSACGIVLHIKGGVSIGNKKKWEQYQDMLVFQ